MQGYRASAERAAILFFVLNDMGTIDPMYQFALDAYTDLYGLSIEKSQRSPKLEERINNLNEYHTYAVYRYCSKGVYMCIVKMFFFGCCFSCPVHTRAHQFEAFPWSLCLCVDHDGGPCRNGRTDQDAVGGTLYYYCLLYTSPSPRDS